MTATSRFFLASFPYICFQVSFFLPAGIPVQSEECRVEESASLRVLLTPLYFQLFHFPFLGGVWAKDRRGCWLGSWQAALICTVNLMKLILQNCAIASSPGLCHFPLGQDKLLHLIKPLCFIRLMRSISKGNLKDYLFVDLSQCLIQTTAIF